MYQYVLDRILRKSAITTYYDFSVLYYVENLDRWCHKLSSPIWKNTRKFFSLQGNVTRGDVKRYTVNFNEIAEQYFKDHVTDILIWRSRAALENYVLKHAPWHLPDGVHMSVSVYDEELQLLFNQLINTKAR